MQDKLFALTVTQGPIAKQKDCLHRLDFAVEDISVLERVLQQLQQTLRLEEYVQRDSTVLLVQHSLEIAHLAHIVVQHS